MSFVLRECEARFGIYGNDYFKEYKKLGGTVKEYNLIFESVDNVTSYTWGFKMIRPEKHTFKWSPKTKSKEDLKLVKDLEQLVKDLDLTKTQLTRKALIEYVKNQNW